MTSSNIKSTKEKNPVDTEDLPDQASRMRAAGYIPATEVSQKMGIALQTVSNWALEESVESELVLRKRYIKLDSLIEHIGDKQAVIFGFVTEDELNKRKKGKSK